MQKVVERILNLLAFLLTVGRPVTADEIRHTVKGYEQPTDEAFRRTFERDKDLLRTLGVPLELRHTDLWEVELGYVVPSDDYGLDDPGLTDEERSALLLASQAVRFGGQRTELGAIFKLGGAARTTESGTVYADLGHDLDQLGALYGAITDKKIARFDYRNRRRQIEPYGLIHRRGRWYLIGPERGAPEPVKAFRVDRMGLIAIDEAVGTFTRAPEFDLKSSLAELPSEGTTDMLASVRFDTDVASIAKRQMPGATEVDRTQASVLLEVPYSADRSLIGWVLGFDDKAVIEAPDELRRALVAFVEAPT
ncbi:MAG: WYL domain-containing protein [Actinomycetia bacterium]|nr:WYL domain-containing protein [Actinomycetes bacterium]